MTSEQQDISERQGKRESVASDEGQQEAPTESASEQTEKALEVWLASLRFG